MSSFFLITEPGIKKAAELSLPPFDFKTAHPLITCARILSGSSAVAYNERVIRLTENWLKKDEPAYSALKIARYISEEATKDKLVLLLNSYRRSNVAFFKKLETEIIQIVLFHKLERNTECFLHIYRCVEYISDAVPVLYLDKVNNFSESIDIINSIAENKVGELGALSKVCKLIADKDETFENLNFTIDLSKTSAADSSNIKKQFNMINLTSDSDWIDDAMEVPYSKMTDFIVTVRNRSFHYMRKQSNIDFSKTGGANTLFSVVNNAAMEWLAIIYFQLLESLYNRHVVSSDT